MDYPFKTIIEPFRIKVVEPLKLTTFSERKKLIAESGLNPFLLKSEDVLIDLLTDSGTTAMSAEQWASVMRSDESYAGSPSFFRFEKALQTLTGHSEIIPTHQGRASERIIFNTLAKPGQWVLSNMLFDTTRANAEVAGCKTLDLPCKELLDPMKPAPFKGNIDLEKLEHHLKEKGTLVAFVVMTITNNSGGGQPASFANIKACYDLCKKHQVPFMIDGCRYAENAWFIKQREPGMSQKTPLEITQMIFALADIISVSAKKDAMGNIGGFICVKDKEWGTLCKNNLILTEGFPTYGGLAGRDLDALATGVFESLEEGYLKYRIRSVEYMGEILIKEDIPIVNPAGGHAIYIDAKAFLSHIPPSQFPGQSFVAGLYEHAGIRACEIGSVMLGRKTSDGKEIPHTQELVRLAIPRRVYTQSHMDYVLEALISFKKKAKDLKGVRFVHEPKILRHFSARFEWVN